MNRNFDETPAGTYLGARPRGGEPLNIIDLTSDTEIEQTPYVPSPPARNSRARSMMDDVSIHPVTLDYQLPLRCADCHREIHQDYDHTIDGRCGPCHAIGEYANASCACEWCTDYLESLQQSQRAVVNHPFYQEQDGEWYNCEVCNRYHHREYINLDNCPSTPRLTNLQIVYGDAIRPLTPVPEDNWPLSDVNEHWPHHPDHDEEGMRFLEAIVQEIVDEEMEDEPIPNDALESMWIDFMTNMSRLNNQRNAN